MKTLRIGLNGWIVAWKDFPQSFPRPHRPPRRTPMLGLWCFTKSFTSARTRIRRFALELILYPGEMDRDPDSGFRAMSLRVNGSCCAFCSSSGAPFQARRIGCDFQCVRALFAAPDIVES